MGGIDSEPPRGEDASDDALGGETLERLLGLLGASAGATGSLEEKRRQIAGGLAAIIGADVWIWARSRISHASVTGGTIFDTVDGGFRDDAERARFLAAVYDPAVSDAFNRSFFAPPPPVDLNAGEGKLDVRTRSIDEAMPEGSSIRDVWRAASGMGPCLISMVPLGGPSWSGLGFHRRLGAAAFTARERRAVHLTVSSVEQLHRDGSDVAANTDALFSFRPRERQVLLYLLAGDQAKQIATKLGISRHTVADYVKVIYRRLNVRTRTELLRLFLPGTPRPGKDA